MGEVADESHFVEISCHVLNNIVAWLLPAVKSPKSFWAELFIDLFPCRLIKIPTNCKMSPLSLTCSFMVIECQMCSSSLQILLLYSFSPSQELSIVPHSINNPNERGTL